MSTARLFALGKRENFVYNVNKLMQKIITQNSQETRNLGAKLSKSLKRGQVICLAGELGAGKTTFAQGFLQGLGIKGPYTSPTFVIMKQYTQPTARDSQLATFKNIYHIDAYRINEKDILSLGWEELIQDKKNILLVEWAERIKKIIPAEALWIKFKGLSEKEREITFVKPKKGLCQTKNIS
jgi:tRNA threonylcarbamoyladenosine biosynthesis protein TsaE